MYIRQFLTAGVALGLALFAGFAGDRHVFAKSEEDLLTGQLLVASPSMRDPRFAKTVIYICRHSRDGAFGLIINRLMAQVPDRVIAEEFDLRLDNSSRDLAVRWGGPVEMGHGFILHSTDHLSQGSTTVEEGVALSTDFELLSDWLNKAGPQQAILLFGYAGWAAGQLENELSRDDWVTVDVGSDFLFTTALETMWDRALALRGFDL